MKNQIILLIGIATSLAFIINLYLTPLLIYISKKHGIFDKVDYRKIHTKDTSRFGGIGIFTSFIISSLVSPKIVGIILNSENIFPETQLRLPLLFISVIVIFITGILDDFTEMRARYKLFGQIFASILATLGGALINRIEIPFTSYVIELGWLAIPLTIIWLVGISNALNLIDGIDGLSAGISIIAAMIFSFVFLLHGHYLPAIISYSLMGSLFGYLFFNYPPAKIFMGDSGSLFLGFILALLPIATFPQSGSSLLLPLTMLLIPILDVVAAIWRRRRDKKKVFSPDRLHVHHKLLDLGLNNRSILAIIYGLCLILGGSVLVYEYSSNNNFLYILPSWLIVIVFFIYLHYNKKN